MPYLPTRFAGIFIDPNVASLSFPQTVNEALAQINSTPAGAVLLSSIVHDRPHLMASYKVLICSTSQRARRGNRTVAFREVPARRNGATAGAGSRSTVGWDEVVVSHQDGARPAFIGLAHELIHARRNLLGLTPVQAETDEAETVGLARPPTSILGLMPPQSGVFQHVTENDIRLEHHIGLRTRYTLDPTTIVVHEWLYLVNRF